ncbi:hypothetical protein ACHQM5_008511 [Ranunculus cassubicifolius]
MGRPPCCDKSNVKRGLWTPEEDAKILAYVSDHGPGNWTSVPKKAGLRRCGKSCRLRYTNYLRPDLKHDTFTPQEEELIINLHAAIGSRWSLIAQQLPGRTDNDVKNHWNTKLKKRLLGVGIDPVTHRPISQILTDYTKIGGLPRPGTRMGTLNRDLKNAFMVKPEPQDDISGMTNHSLLPIFDTGFNINGNNHSMELLAQFQAIKLVSDQASSFSNKEVKPPLLFGEGSSYSSDVFRMEPQPSSVPKTPPSPFCWSDFLQEDAFLPPMQITECINADNMPTSEGANFTQNYHPTYAYPRTGVAEASESLGASSSSESSFVEAILDRDSEMSWDFPGLLEDPYY